MMNVPFSNLYSSFTASLHWNALLFIVYKILFTITSLVLFNRLSVNNFSVWANLNSFIFLLLLWLDLGFRKSIPRYCHEFKKHGFLHAFKDYLFVINAVVLGLTLPLFPALSGTLFSILGLSCPLILIYICSGIFFIEGINSTTRIFYHAHLLNKWYTLIQAVFLLFEWTINLIGITALKLDTSILILLFTNKLIISSCNAIVSICFLNFYYKKAQPQQISPKGRRNHTKEFVIHTGIMWFGNSIKSLTERNFLVPFITQVVSPASANLFKIANDWAMLIHRPIVKTIGSSDTVLLSHIHSSYNQSISIAQARRTLIVTILFACLPFCCIIPTILLFISSAAALIFLVISCGHILEIILSPYERILEVKRCYRYLIISYFPYLCTLGGIGYYFFLPASNMLVGLICIHLARLSSSFLMVYFSKKTDASLLAIKPAISDQPSPSTHIKPVDQYPSQKQRF